jgi:hypothetical protein
MSLPATSLIVIEPASRHVREVEVDEGEQPTCRRGPQGQLLGSTLRLWVQPDMIAVPFVRDQRRAGTRRIPASPALAGGHLLLVEQVRHLLPAKVLVPQLLDALAPRPVPALT